MLTLTFKGGSSTKVSSCCLFSRQKAATEKQATRKQTAPPVPTPRLTNFSDEQSKKYSSFGGQVGA